MDTRTREALEASIRHWERNVSADTPEDVKTDAEDCALCEMFYDGNDSGNCQGCPVAVSAQDTFCRGTPYVKAEAARIRWFNGGIDAGPTFRRYAQAELDFLRSLLPTEEEGSANA